MTILSFEFLIFLILVFILYWFVFKNTAVYQNVLLCLSSLIFYLMADWHLSLILFFSVLFNFYVAGFITLNKGSGRLLLLITGVCANILILSYFKFSGYFYGGWLHMILPLGISFYTFQAIGYLVDVHNEQISPCNGLLTFTTYMAYFPKITAGPIEPAGPFFKQIEIKREFSYALAVDGLRQILWGAFLKLVIADNCASIATPVFDNYRHLPAGTLWMGAFFYLFQVYCDFSGYSNIAIGISKLFGIRLIRNFSSPFFSTNISEFWKKWNISLSSWMMKYVFYPLSFTFRRLGKAGLIISILLTFLIIGLWHGVNATFLIFGALHGLYFIPVILNGKINKNKIDKENFSFPSGKGLLSMISLFLLVMLTIIFFGADSASQAAGYIRGLFSFSIFTKPVFPESVGYSKIMLSFFFILLLVLTEWVQRGRSHEMQIDNIKNRGLRLFIYYSIFICIILFGSSVHLDFIYSQF